MNFCESFQPHLANHPDFPAIKDYPPAGGVLTLSYSALFALAACYQQRLHHTGLRKGDRVVLMLPLSADFYALLYALLGAGIIPILLEKGLSFSALRHCFQVSRPTAMLTAKGVARYWFLIPELRRLQRFSIAEKRWGMRLLADRPAATAADFIVENVQPQSTALLTFTNGSTGLPKGANRTHAGLLAQARALENDFPLKQQHDMSAFPVLTLFSHYSGSCSHLMQHLDTARLADTLNQQDITQFSAAPQRLNLLLDEACRHNLFFPTVKKLVAGGAPVNKTLLQHCLERFPAAECYLNYGSTEAEPIAKIAMTTMLRLWDEKPGYPVGQPSGKTRVLIRRLPLAAYDDLTAAAPGDIGEILVSGPHVLQRYFNQPEASRLSKITDNSGTLWHCTGDTGFVDSEGMLWLTGRVNDRITCRDGQIVDAFVVEKTVNEIAGIERSALIARPQGGAALVLQNPALPVSLSGLLCQWFKREDISVHPTDVLPVDPRHQSRIDRAALRRLLASGQIRPIAQGDIQ